MQPLQSPEKRADMAAGLIGISILLIPSAVMDIWKRKLPVIYLAVLLTAAVPLNLLTGRTDVWDLILGIVYGGTFLLVSIATRGAIGFGDGIMIASLGAWMGICFTLPATVFAFLSAGFFGLIYIRVKKKDRKTKLPFAPFLAAASLTLAVIELASGS